MNETPKIELSDSEIYNEIMLLAQQAQGMGNNEDEYNNIIRIAEAFKAGTMDKDKALEKAREIINSKNEV